MCVCCRHTVRDNGVDWGRARSGHRQQRVHTDVRRRRQDRAVHAEEPHRQLRAGAGRQVQGRLDAARSRGFPHFSNFRDNFRVGKQLCFCIVKGKGKVFPYSLLSVGPGADPGVQAVSPQVT